MLQSLEAADGLAELLARLRVFDGRGVRRLHGANGLGAQRRDAALHGALERRRRIAAAEHLARGKLHVLEEHIGGTASVLRAVAHEAHARRIRIDQEYREPMLAGFRTHEQQVGHGAVGVRWPLRR